MQFYLLLGDRAHRRLDRRHRVAQASFDADGVCVSDLLACSTGSAMLGSASFLARR